MDFSKSMAVAASGMRAQTERMKIIAENIANANSTSPVTGRRSLSPQDRDHQARFRPRAGRHPGQRRQSDPRQKRIPQPVRPGNPNADKQGYVKLPNVDSLVEIMDMREAQRSYEADLTVMESTKQMLAKTVDLLK